MSSHGDALGTSLRAASKKAGVQCERATTVLCESNIMSGAPITVHPVRHGGNLAGKDGESGSASSMNFFTLVVYKAKHHGRSPLAGLWVSAGFFLALLEVSVIYGLIFNYLSPPCFTHDDCNIGTACMNYDAHPGRSFCFDCNFVINHAKEISHEPSNVTQAFAEYCKTSLEGWTSGWKLPRPINFDNCLYITNSLKKATATDHMVTVFAFCYMAAAIAKERQQQLYTQALRRAWFPRVHLSWHAAVLCATDATLSWLVLGWVPMAMLSLVLGGSDGFSAQNMVLNGLSIAFILVLDDELAEFLLSADEKEKIEEELKEASKGLVRFRLNKIKGFVRSFTTVVALVLGTMLASNLPCVTAASLIIWTCAIGLGTFGAWACEAAVDVRAFGFSLQILKGHAFEVVVVILCNALGTALWESWNSLSGLDLK